MGSSSATLLPLCVDLDGTLIKTDTLHELAVKLTKKQFLKSFSMPLWLSKGKAHLKSRLTESVDLYEKLLPYDSEVINFITSEKEKGRPIYLATGCNQQLAEKISNHVNLFDGVFGSTDELNLTGTNKAKFLVDKFGQRGFDYVGNEKTDIKVWDECHQTVAVGSPDFLSFVKSKYAEAVTIARAKPNLKTTLKAIRIHQWTKNSLLFVPFLLNHPLSSGYDVFAAIAGFLAFSLLASATYIVNDLLDLEADRSHHKKRYRAFASGDISILGGMKLFSVLSLATLILLLFLPIEFAAVLLVYLVTTLLYSFHLKTMVILDACVLAGLFTVRIIAGMVAIDADWSFWLLAFSMFFFLSLAFTKRASELHALLQAGSESAKGRGYIVSDTVLVTATGISAGYVGVLVIALYINSEKVSSNYGTPYFLWLICPLLLYWIGRVWLKTARGEMNEDPIIFAIKDRISHYTAILCGLALIAASISW